MAGMLTQDHTDFFIQYIDLDSGTVRSYYPDFILSARNAMVRKNT